MLDEGLLRSREMKTCLALTNDDMDRLKVVDPIAFLHENAVTDDKPITIFASEIDLRDHVTSSDLCKCRRYKVSRVISIEGIFPRKEIVQIKCPVCNTSYYNPYPRYIINPCPKGCSVNPSRYIIEDRGQMVDVASCFVVIDSKTRGVQKIHVHVEGANLDINANYAKLQMAASASGDLHVEGIPFLEFAGDRFQLCLWITRVAVSIESIDCQTDRQVEFTVDMIPTDEKGVVEAVFFKNLEFMKHALGFDKYNLQSGFPDLIVRRHDGTKLVIEFEFESRNFDRHGHDPAVVDYIICWIDNRTADDVKTISLQNFVGKKITVVGNSP